MVQWYKSSIFKGFRDFEVVHYKVHFEKMQEMKGFQVVQMTFDEAYKKINRVRNLNKKIDGQIERREELFTRATKTNAVLTADRVQTSVQGDKTANLIGEIVDLEKELDAMIDQLVDMKEELVKEIMICSDKKVRKVLLGRYVNCQSQKCVSHNLHVSVRRVQQLQETGIRLYAETFQ